MKIQITYRIYNFNFHHRVVETTTVCRKFQFQLSFNFHHRVVETSAFDIAETSSNTSLTFTIGWLKPEISSIAGLSEYFNFHHRVVETCCDTDFFNQSDFNFHHRVVETMCP